MFNGGEEMGVNSWLVGRRGWFILFYESDVMGYEQIVDSGRFMKKSILQHIKLLYPSETTAPKILISPPCLYSPLELF